MQISSDFIMQLWLMLFSDIVLLTQRNGKLFTCVENPIELDNLMVPDISINERKPHPWDLTCHAYPPPLAGHTCLKCHVIHMPMSHDRYNLPKVSTFWGSTAQGDCV